MSHYKSKFEVNVAKALKKAKTKFDYETKKFPFVQPAIKRTYTPDFELYETGTFVECKGKLTLDDRKKLLWVKETYPDLRLVLLFQRAKNPLRKGSKTTYAQWASENGFDWADFDEGIPERWYKQQQKGKKE